MSVAQTLAERQSAFMAQVLDDEAPLPDGWGERQGAGMNVYRGNYRSSVVDALKSTYEKTERWVGEDMFQRAAAHHVITNPPASWTLDDAGAGFDSTCAELFRNDPEVSELAWLEWRMLEVFTGEDIQPLNAEGFAAQSASFTEEDWGNLRLTFLPAAAAREVNYDLRAMWNALNEDEFIRPEAGLEAPASILVWREGERSTFMMGSTEEAQAFNAAKSGMPYAEICMLLAGENPTDEQAQDAAMRAGGLLGRWLNEGLIASISV